jgi:hypothetical protein
MPGDAAWVFECVDPEIAPGVVIAHDARWIFLAADDEFGVGGSAGMFSGGLVAQV